MEYSCAVMREPTYVWQFCFPLVYRVLHVHLYFIKLQALGMLHLDDDDPFPF